MVADGFPRSRFNADATAPLNPHDPAAHQPPPPEWDGKGPEALQHFGEQFAELREYVNYLAATKIDGIRAQARRAGIWAALGLLGLMAVGTLVVVAAALVLIGIANGLGLLFGGHYWLGAIVTGVVFLGALAGASAWGLKYATRTFYHQVVGRYEQRRQQQRSRFGHDVEEVSHKQP